MSVCAGTRGNAGDPRAKLGLAHSGGMSWKGRGAFARWNYIYHS